MLADRLADEPFRVRKGPVRRRHGEPPPHRREARLDQLLAQGRNERAEVQWRALEQPIARLRLEASEELVPHLRLAEEEQERAAAARVELIAERLQERCGGAFAEAAHAFELIESEHDRHVGEVEEGYEAPVGALLRVERLFDVEQLQIV